MSIYLSYWMVDLLFRYKNKVELELDRLVMVDFSYGSQFFINYW